MPDTYSLTLALVAVAGFALGLLLPVRARRARPGMVDGVLVGLGWLGLAFHCGAMFFRPVVTGVPGTVPLVDAVDALGPASVVAYVVPALLLLVGLRRAGRVALIAAAVVLLAVGVTMYDGGSLAAHLTAIFVAVVLLAVASGRLLARAVRPVRDRRLPQPA